MLVENRPPTNAFARFLYISHQNLTAETDDSDND
jgi:hypothetical protein